MVTTSQSEYDDDELQRLARIAVHPLRSRDPAVNYEDMQQEAVINILRRPAFARELDVYRARYAALDVLRRSQSKRRQQQERLPETYQVAAKWCVLEEMECREERERIIAVRSLSKQQRMVVREMLNGKTASEIADETGFSLSSLANATKEAVKRIQVAMGIEVTSGDIWLGHGKHRKIRPRKAITNRPRKD